MEPGSDRLRAIDEALRRLHETMAACSVTNGDVPTLRSALDSRAADNHQAAGIDSPAVDGFGGNSSWQEMLNLRSSHSLTCETSKPDLSTCLDCIPEIMALIIDHPYCMPLHILQALKYLQLGYPDLAAGAAYKALLLSDALQDDADEYYEVASEALGEVLHRHALDERIQMLERERRDEAAGGNCEKSTAELDVEEDLWLRKHYLPLTYRILARSLLLCGCYRSAHDFVGRGRRLYADDFGLREVHDDLHSAMKKQSNRDKEDAGRNECCEAPAWPDRGFVRREIYPWNDHEPDRFGNLDALNAMMAAVAPKLEVRAVQLPILTDKENSYTGTTATQLGIFATQDIEPGEVVLDETSMLTANNKLQDALCDACSADLPGLTCANPGTVACPECQVVYCSARCFDLAMKAYHPALCDKDVEAIAKDVPPALAADSLYTLLLLRCFALAETHDCHPLELNEVKYIWGDFDDLLLQDSKEALPPKGCCPPNGLLRKLPFSFEHNITLPFHMLEKMDIDIFANPQYDVWVFNTLYAKFRGTASARLSGLGGRAIRGPEVSAVHPMWCLANHSCDPNVRWEWGGSIKFWASKERPVWRRSGDERFQTSAGIVNGQEVLNHYCDIDLPVNERRDWARGALGGDCRCERCEWEVRHSDQP